MIQFMGSHRFIWQFTTWCFRIQIEENMGIISENRYEYIPIYLSSVFSNVIAPIDKEVTADILEKMLNKFEKTSTKK